MSCPKSYLALEGCQADLSIALRQRPFSPVRFPPTFSDQPSPTDRSRPTDCHQPTAGHSQVRVPAVASPPRPGPRPEVAVSYGLKPTAQGGGIPQELPLVIAADELQQCPTVAPVRPRRVQKRRPAPRPLGQGQAMSCIRPPVKTCRFRSHGINRPKSATPDAFAAPWRGCQRVLSLPPPTASIKPSVDSNVSVSVPSWYSIATSIPRAAARSQRSARSDATAPRYAPSASAEPRRPAHTRIKGAPSSPARSRIRSKSPAESPPPAWWYDP